ncbi:MAG: hypothetical protein K0S74_758 [Chlamydiales bacterium]|jgi:Zn-dependent protease|nr:hypothetical protein [Chlamydiales bacterium]
MISALTFIKLSKKIYWKLNVMRISGAIPITFHPFCWVLPLSFSFILTQSPLLSVVWAIVMLLSILIHEMGHAWMALFFKQTATVELTFFGGVTRRNSEPLVWWKEFLIILQGPLVGIGVYLFCELILKTFTMPQAPDKAFILIGTMNLVWSIFQLIPIVPLDGGTLLTLILQKMLGITGKKIAIGFSAVLSLLLGSIAFFLDSPGNHMGLILGTIWFILSFENINLLRLSWNLNDTDTKQELQYVVKQAQVLMSLDKLDQALDLYYLIRSITKKGQIYQIATEKIASILAARGQIGEAYDLLLPIQNKLSYSAACLLQKLAYYKQNFTLVINIGDRCFLEAKHKDIALLNAIVHAQYGHIRETIGWLQALKQLEPEYDYKQLLQQTGFEALIKNEKFQKWFNSHIQD